MKSAASGWIALAGAIAFEVMAALSMKGALDRPILFVVVVAGYVASFACLSRVLQAGIPLGVAYGFWGAAGVVATAILSSVLFDEQLTMLMGIGIALTIIGVLCVRIGAEIGPKKSEAV